MIPDSLKKFLSIRFLSYIVTVSPQNTLGLLFLRVTIKNIYHPNYL